MKKATENGHGIPVESHADKMGTGHNAMKWIATTLTAGAVCFIAGRYTAPTAAPPGMLAAAPVEALTAAPARVEAPTTVVIVKTNFVSVAEPGWAESKWNELLSEPGTVARNQSLAALLEKLAATDPKRAITLAQAEGNLKLRDTLTQAALHGWARTAPQDAANWAAALTDPAARDAAINSVFAGAVAGNPEEAVHMANNLMQQNGGEASSYGSRLIDALVDAGNFAVATQLAAGGTGSVQRSLWMAEAYSKWAELQPAQAAQAANAITDPAARSDALHGVVGGWASTDPAGLTQFLVQLPASDDRGQMIGQGLENWARLDPTAVANWMNQHGNDLGTDIDKGMQSIATVAELKPDVAVAWAEGIIDPTLRSQALNDVLRNWVANDLQAAKTYFDNTQNLLPADRQQIGEILAGLNQVSAQ